MEHMVRRKNDGGGNGDGAETAPSARANVPESDTPLARARKVMDAVFGASRPLSSLEIARRCGLDPSSAHRLIQNLAANGFLLRNDETRRYLPHPKVLFPFPIYHPWELVRRDAASLIVPLRDRLLLNTGIVAFYFGTRVMVELAPGRDPLNPSYQTVLESPLHASGSGKVLLSTMTEEERRRQLGPGPLEQFTPLTIVDHAALTEDLEVSRQRGFVTALDDYISGFRVVSAPLSVDGVVMGCIFCSGASHMVSDERIPEIAQEVKRAATLFSRASTSLRQLAVLLGVDHSGG